MTGSTANEPTRHGLTVASYAEITALLRHYPPERSGQVLAQKGVAKDQWDAAAAAWSQTIEDDMTRDQPQLVLSFAATFKETRKRLTIEQPELPLPREQPLPAAPAAPVPMTSTSLPRPIPDATFPAESPWAGRAPLPAADRTSDVLPAIAEDSLPFGPTPSPAFVAQMSAPAAQRDSWESSAVNETAAVPAIEGEGAPITLPFRRTDASLAWTMEQLASICAELSVSPEKKDEILRRYKVDEPAWQRLHAELQRRVADDPRERDHFQALLTEFRSWLLQHKQWGGRDR